MLDFDKKGVVTSVGTQVESDLRRQIGQKIFEEFNDYSRSILFETSIPLNGQTNVGPTTDSHNAGGTIPRRGRHNRDILSRFINKIDNLLDRCPESVNCKDVEGRTLLQLALIRDYWNARLVKFFLERGADPNTPVADGLTLLLVSIERGNTEAVKLLLEFGADVEIKDVKPFRTPLHIAAKKGRQSLARLLLEKGATVDSVNGEGRTPLHIAVKEGYYSLVLLLLEKGAAVNLKDKEGKTPLHIATKKKNQSLARLLLEKGAVVDLMDWEENTPLHIAAKERFHSLALLLLEKGAAVNLKDKEGKTPLHIAVEEKHQSLALLLLEKGSAINLKDKEGKTPLHVAADNSGVGFIKLLLKHGAYVDSSDVQRKTPLHVAVANYSSLRDLRLLLEKGANVDAQSLEGNTALHIAAEKGYEGIAKLLLDRAANVGLRNSNGFSACQLAKENGWNNVVQLLLDHGKDKMVRAGLELAKSNEQGKSNSDTFTDSMASRVVINEARRLNEGYAESLTRSQRDLCAIDGDGSSTEMQPQINLGHDIETQENLVAGNQVTPSIGTQQHRGLRKDTISKVRTPGELVPRYETASSAETELQVHVSNDNESNLETRARFVARNEDALSVETRQEADLSTSYDDVSTVGTQEGLLTGIEDIPSIQMQVISNDEKFAVKTREDLVAVNKKMPSSEKKGQTAISNHDMSVTEIKGETDTRDNDLSQKGRQEDLDTKSGIQSPALRGSSVEAESLCDLQDSNTLRRNDETRAYRLLFISSTFLQNLFRPRVAKDHQRITWICGCGKPMYADVKEILPGAALALQEILRLSAAATSHGSSNPEHESASSSTGSQQQSKIHKHPGPPHKQDSTNPESHSTNPPVAKASATGTAAKTSECMKRYLLLCINTTRRVHLEQIELGPAGDDQDLFQAIRQAYYNTRKKHALGQYFASIFGELSFSRPKSANFVRFELVPMKAASHAAVLDFPSLPPPEEVTEKKRYHYQPCPKDIQNPLLEIQFLHEYFHPGQHLGRFWLNRIPKKLKDKLFYTSDTFRSDALAGPEALAIGWGIHIIEEADRFVFGLVGMVVVALSGVLVVVYSGVMHDVSGGLGMGAYAVAVQIVVLTTLFFKWQQA